jgi:hypothetical protein
MSIDALPFVNWIFWDTLTAGSLLVVGGTELWGGTTRGYRLFMAGLLTVCAAILLLSELNLAPGTWADATADERRTLVWIFAGLTVAYLVASIAKWPRGGLAVAAGMAGILSLVVLAAAGGSLSAPLFALQLALSAVALGAAAAAMLLGHWYLVTPQLSPAPLVRMVRLLAGALLVQGLACAAAFLLISSGPLGGPIGWITWLRLVVGIGLPIVISVLAILASRAASLQATTGLLYIGLAFVMAGSIAGASITLLTGVPV